MRSQRIIPVAIVSVALLAALAVVLLLTRTEPKGASDPSRPSSSESIGAGYVRIDAHAHLSIGSLPLLTELMSRYGFHHVVDLSGGTPDAGLAQHLAQAQASGGRVTVYMTLVGRDTRRPDFPDNVVMDLERAKQMGAKGLKIPKGLGLGYYDWKGKLLAVDDPRLDPIFETCGRLGFPVTIHTADPKAFWQPPDDKNERYDELRVHPAWSFYDKPVPSWQELIAQLERRIARHPNTKIIAVHFGNAAEDPDGVARMLRAYPNLYIDTAARIPEFGRHAKDKMRAFFLEFQDRILYGTDLGVGVDAGDLMLGSTDDKTPGQADIDRFFRSSYRYFETPNAGLESPTPIQGRWTVNGLGLPAEVLRKIYGVNAHKVMGIEVPPGG